MRLFDAYLMMDWSARNKPKRGEDSIWYCLVTCRGGRPAVAELINPSTRFSAAQKIGNCLVELTSEGFATLVGFDFPYGYPSGFAAALGLRGEPPWRMIWEYLTSHVQDEPDNKSNRFDVAAKINRRISGIASPFWGCPQGRKQKYLKSKKPKKPSGISLADSRLTDL